MLTGWKSKRLSNTQVREEKTEHPSLFMKLQIDVTKKKVSNASDKKQFCFTDCWFREKNAYPEGKYFSCYY